ncbi:MAG: transcription termination/antitermination protein NusG [Beijerinckiaceae bacterium]
MSLDTKAPDWRATPSTDEPWFLAQVRPNCGHIAERNLRRQGFDVFAPVQYETRRHGARFVTRPQALFPGYIFVSFDPGLAPWRVINSTYGVTKLVTFGRHQPSQIPDELMTALIARCDATGALLPPGKFNPGEMVQVVSGPFAQFVATVETLAPQQRVWVLLDIMGGSTRVAVSAGDLRRL